MNGERIFMDDEEVTLLPHERDTEVPDNPDTEIRDRPDISDTQQEVWLLQTEPFMGLAHDRLIWSALR